MAQLHFSVEREDDRVTVRVNGEITAETATQFSKELLGVLEEKPKVMVLDLSGVPYIASPGLGAIVSLIRKAKQAGSELYLRNASPQIKEILQITHLDRIIPWESSVPSTAPTLANEVARGAQGPEG